MKANLCICSDSVDVRNPATPHREDKSRDAADHKAEEQNDSAKYDFILDEHLMEVVQGRFS